MEAVHGVFVSRKSFLHNMGQSFCLARVSLTPPKGTKNEAEKEKFNSWLGY